MIRIDGQTFIVFDLDDTLYKENLYHDSGLRAVCRLVEKLYGVNVEKSLSEWKSLGVDDLWGRLCQQLDLPGGVKESFLWEYRLHCPDIKLDNSAKQILSYLESFSQGIAILTDGRSVTQRLKLVALGLNQYPVYISEEWNSTKPCEKRFIEIMNQYPAKQYVYIGDNPQKDFKAANDLGWLTIGLRGHGFNVHSQDLESLSQKFLPQFWIDSLRELFGFSDNFQVGKIKK